MSKTSENSLGLAPLTHIKASLDRIFKKGVWIDWEIETISDELGVAFDELTRDKIHVLQLIEKNPNLIFDDISFFLYATEVINNRVADFESLPMPTSLEIAYALHTIKQILGTNYKAPAPDSSLAQTIGYLLKEDGYSEPIEPFSFINDSHLEKGQTPLDTEYKKKAIEVYIKVMDNL
jgi:hypothetical protein